MLGMSLSPCCRFHPAEVNIRIGQSSAAHAAFALQLKARPSEILIFEATMRSLLLRPGELVAFPGKTLSIGFRVSVSITSAIQTTGL